ncbi:hypothetical protein PVAND_016472 [Polypedilum vanderplanki]|uniref:Uncharacterized protein n=1 Tax=Polypedilum vanderplanki TaxID=319348 RepID=A0A9J6BGD7_POLVA|nr:hypothetical protein PVAND_016472 [Polypedilum vanderplanki]
MTKLECEVLSKTISSHKCYLRAYNRRSPSGNVEIFLERKPVNVKLAISGTHKLTKDGIQKPIFNVENIEICKFIKVTSTDLYLKAFIEWFSSILKDVDQICTDKGQISFYNFTIPESPYLMVLPNGYYETVYTFSDDLEKNILKVFIHAKINVRVTKFECKTSKKTISDCNCTIRAYNRRSPVMNADFIYKRITDNLKITFRPYHKLQLESSYKQVFEFEGVEICKIMKGANDNKFFKTVIDWIRTILPNFDRVCTHKGKFSFRNITFPDSPFVKVFPVGYYMAKFIAHDELDDMIFQALVNLIFTKQL